MPDRGIKTENTISVLYYISAPRNPFLSQRLQCETTGRSATAPDLDDEGSPRGAAYRCTHIGRGHNATLNILS